MDDPFQRWEVLSHLLKHLLQVIEPGDIGAAHQDSAPAASSSLPRLGLPGKRRRGGHQDEIARALGE